MAFFPGSMTAQELDLRKEAALFAMTDLGPVDLSPKMLAVEVYVAPQDELSDFRTFFPEVWKQVQQFYNRLGVKLTMYPVGPTPGPLAPAQRLRLEVLAHKDWLTCSLKAFNIAPPFRLRFLAVCRDKFAFAHLPLSTIHVSYKRFQELELSDHPGKGGLNRIAWLANLLIHELGHLLGLYHTHEFTNDPVGDYLPDGVTPNFMSHDIAKKPQLGFVEFQRRVVHSYLEKGKVFKQYQYVEFDPLRYLELVKKHNGYQEPARGKAAWRQLQTVAWPIDEDEDEEED